MDHPGDNKDLRIKRHFYKINLWTTCKLHVFYVKYLFQDSTKYKKTWIFITLIMLNIINKNKIIHTIPYFEKSAKNFYKKNYKIL